LPFAPHFLLFDHSQICGSYFKDEQQEHHVIKSCDEEASFSTISRPLPAVKYLHLFIIFFSDVNQQQERDTHKEQQPPRGGRCP